MSACLFMMNNDWWDKTPIEEINALMKMWYETIDDFEKNSGDKHSNRFYCDQYQGYSQNVERGMFYLMGVARAAQSI